jgi:ribose/xylose/arabinose/galactoside ABC-type transport system permease subunit
MRRLVAIAALAGGLLLLLVPRYILPACEYEGYSPMHCSDTARAEYLVGALLIALGAGTYAYKKAAAFIATAAASFLLYGIALWLPDAIGYCHSSRMPCNYGMVPGIRFISVLGMALTAIAGVGLLREQRKKGNP